MSATVEDLGFSALCNESGSKGTFAWLLGGLAATVASAFMFGRDTEARAEKAPSRRREVTAAMVRPRAFLELQQIWKSLSDDPFPYEATEDGKIRRVATGEKFDLPNMPRDVFDSIKNRFASGKVKNSPQQFVDIVEFPWTEADTAVYRVAEAARSIDPIRVTMSVPSEIGEPEEHPVPTSMERKIAYARALIAAEKAAMERSKNSDPEGATSRFADYPPEMFVAGVADALEDDDADKERAFLTTASRLHDIENYPDEDVDGDRYIGRTLYDYAAGTGRLELYRAAQRGMSPEAMRAMIALFESAVTAPDTERRVKAIRKSVDIANQIDAYIKPIRKTATRRRMAAVMLEDLIEKEPNEPFQNALRLASSMEWEGPYAPEYPLLHPHDARRVAKGESIKKVFHPVDYKTLQVEPILMNGRPYLPDSKTARTRAVMSTCEKALQNAENRQFNIYELADVKREFSNIASRFGSEPKAAEWMIGVCGEPDPLRFDAFVKEREFSTPFGVRYRSSLLRRSAGVTDQDIQSPKDSPERVVKSAEARDLRRRQEAYIRSHPSIISPTPYWWPNERFQNDLMKAQGIVFEHLQSPKEILEYGTEIEACSMYPETYCPKVEEGESILVRLKSRDGEESLMEIDRDTGEVIQHRGRNNAPVSRASDQAGKLLSGLFQGLSITAFTEPYGAAPTMREEKRPRRVQTFVPRRPLPAAHYGQGEIQRPDPFEREADYD